MHRNSPYSPPIIQNWIACVYLWLSDPMCPSDRSSRTSRYAWSMRRSRESLDSTVCPSWCNRISCTRECHGTAAMNRTATVYSDWCEHSACRCSSATVAIVTYLIGLAFRMLWFVRSRWLGVRPILRSQLWFACPSSSFLCLCKGMMWK